jgi:hypothetical protein
MGPTATEPHLFQWVITAAAWFYSGFSTWLSTATIKDVIDTGPVPTFNPGANIFSGPVVKGTANGGVITPAPVWTAP